MGIPPTNRAFAQDYIHIVRFRDGKAVEHWGVETTSPSCTSWVSCRRDRSHMRCPRSVGRGLPLRRVAGHDGRGHKDDAVAVAQRVLSALRG